MDKIINSLKLLEDKYKLIKWLKKIGIFTGVSILIRQVFLAKENILTYLNYHENIKNIFFSFSIIIIAISIQILIWIKVMRIFNVSLPTFPAFIGFSLSFIPKYIPGTFWGYVSRTDWLATDFNINRKVSLFGIIIEFIFSLSSVFFMVLLNYTSLDFIIYLCLLVLLFLLIYFSLRFILKNRIIMEYVGEKRITNLSVISTFLTYAMSIAVWFIYGLGLFILAGNNFDYLYSSHGFNILYRYSTSFSVAWLMGFLAVLIPSGIGVRENVLANLLEINLNIGQLNATSLSIIFRVVILLAELVLVIFGVIYKYVILRRRRN